MQKFLPSGGMMQQGTRRERASVEALYPIHISPGMAPGCTFDAEVGSDEAVYLSKVFRLLRAWCRDEALFHGSPGEAWLDAWRCALESCPLDPDVRYPLVTIAQQLQSRSSADPHLLSLSCLAVADWAIARKAIETALLFGEAAALASPSNPRFAWVAGKLFRSRARFREAEHWLQRTVHVAAAVKDRRAHALAVNSLGNLHRQRGSFKLAARHLGQALTLARRHRLPDLEAEVLHDLSLLNTFTGNYRDAERHAVLAYERYGSGHPNLPKLAHDIALIWTEQGFFERALSVYQALLPHFENPEERLRVLAAVIRCAGAVSKSDVLERYWPEAWAIGERPEAATVRAATLLDMGRGAAGLEFWPRASDALTRALRTANERGEHEHAAIAEASLELVRRHQALDLAPRSSRERLDAEGFAHRVVSGLGHTSAP